MLIYQRVVDIPIDIKRLFWINIYPSTIDLGFSQAKHVSQLGTGNRMWFIMTCPSESPERALFFVICSIMLA